MNLAAIEALLTAASANGQAVVTLSVEVVQQLIAIVKLIESDVTTDLPTIQKVIPALSALKKLF